LAKGRTSSARASASFDAVFAPAFRYFDVFDGIADLGVFSGAPKVSGWRQALAARPSVAGAVVPDYRERLGAFLKQHAGVITQLAAS
jgi:glutathione S-transferase